MKTKKVDQVDLPASAFAYVGDAENTATWKLPIYFGGDQVKTRNHVKDALGRFADTKGIPEEQREAVKLILVGAAKAHGVDVQDFTAAQPAIKVMKEPPATQDDEALKEVLALADYRADQFLKQLGLE